MDDTNKKKTGNYVTSLISDPDFYMYLHLLVSASMFFVSIVKFYQTIPDIVFQSTWTTSAVVLTIAILLAIYRMEGNKIYNTLGYVFNSSYPIFKIMSVVHIIITILMTFFHYTTGVHEGADVAAWGLSFIVIAIVLLQRSKHQISKFSETFNTPANKDFIPMAP